VKKLLTHAIMLDPLIVAYIQFVTMLREIKKMLSNEPKCLCSKSTTDVLERTLPNTMGVTLAILLH